MSQNAKHSWCTLGKQKHSVIQADFWAETPSGQRCSVQNFLTNSYCPFGQHISPFPCHLNNLVHSRNIFKSEFPSENNLPREYLCAFPKEAEKKIFTAQLLDSECRVFQQPTERFLLNTLKRRQTKLCYFSEKKRINLFNRLLSYQFTPDA